MTFYDDKKKFYIFVKKVIKQNPDGITQEELILKINFKFGFGKKILMDFLENLHETGQISFGEGLIIWKKD